MAGTLTVQESSRARSVESFLAVQTRRQYLLDDAALAVKALESVNKSSHCETFVGSGSLDPTISQDQGCKLEEIVQTMLLCDLEALPLGHMACPHVSLCWRRAPWRGSLYFIDVFVCGQTKLPLTV